MKYDTINDSDLSSSINKVIVDRGLSNTAIQNVIINILIHVNKHGEVSKANQLIKGMDESDSCAGTDVKAVKDFLESFGKMTWDKEAGVMAHDKSKQTLLNGAKEAKATMWWSFKKKAVPSAFDYDAEVSKLNKKASKQAARQAELLSEGKDDEALAISINLKKLQAIRLIMTGTIDIDVIIQMGRDTIAKAA